MQNTVHLPTKQASAKLFNILFSLQVCVENCNFSKNTSIAIFEFNSLTLPSFQNDSIKIDKTSLLYLSIYNYS